MVIEIPKEFVPVLKTIASITAEEAEKTLNILRALKPCLKQDDLLEQVKDPTPFSNSEILSIFRLNAARFGGQVSPERFAQDITSWMAINGLQPKGDLTPAMLQARLLEFLTIAPVVLSARAFDVQHECQTIYDSARIVTDIRPVFAPSGEIEASGLMIVHNLKIAYSESGEYFEKFFAMDDRDLAALKSVIERAELKTGALKSLIRSSGAYFFD